jgi:hypothetical protein
MIISRKRGDSHFGENAGPLLLARHAKNKMRKLAKATIAVILLAASMALAQGEKTEVKKPVSQYMRGVALIYLEHISDLHDKCLKGYEVCNEVLDEWDKLFEPLEDRIEIALSEKGRPAGDKDFFQLLKDTKETTHFFLFAWQDQFPDIKNRTGREKKGKRRAFWGHVYATCYATAHTVALRGTMFQNDCNDAMTDQIERDISQVTESECKEDGWMWVDGKCNYYSDGRRH